MSAAEHTHAHQHTHAHRTDESNGTHTCTSTHTLILTCVFRDAKAITVAISPMFTGLRALSSELLLHPHTRPRRVHPSFAEEEAASFVTHLMSVEI